MHTEHLQNVHPVRILAGWLVAVAATAVAVFGIIGLGLMGEEAGPDAVWAVLAVAVGFLIGGWFTGMRTIEAPILHGIALGLTSLLVWAVLNVVVVLAFGLGEWSGLGATATLVVVLTQMIAAVVGCWIGTSGARARAEADSHPPASEVGGRGTE